MLRRFLLLPLLFAVTACGQASPPLTVTPTATTAPTLTALPTATPTSSPTSFPPLSGEKPYLMIEQNYPDSKLVIYNANGTGRKVVELPQDGHTESYILSNIVSPDGQWLVFYTGNFASNYTTEKLPITLKLFHTGNGTVKTVANVVTGGYTEKLDRVVEKLKKREPDYYQSIDDVDWVSGSVTSAFEWSIYSVSWSPNSRMLVFAAQIDGISSDLYLYDLEMGTIQQIEESLQSVSTISWSPDSKYIVFRNSHPGNVYTGSSLHAVTLGKQVIKEPQTLYSGTWMSVREWFSQNTLLISDGSDTAGNFNLHALNIQTGQAKTLWKGSIGGYAIDYKNKMIAINTGEFRESDWGLYFVTFDGKQKKIWDGVYYAELFFRGGEKHRFLMAGISNDKIAGAGDMQVSYSMAGAVGLALDGKPTTLRDFRGENSISISPDYDWLLIFDEDKLYLHDKNDELLKTFPIPGIKRVVWRPDSQAIFYATETDLYTLSLPDGTSKWVDAVNLYDAVWLP